MHSNPTQWQRILVSGQSIRSVAKTPVHESIEYRAIGFYSLFEPALCGKRVAFFQCGGPDPGLHFTKTLPLIQRYGVLQIGGNVRADRLRVKGPGPGNCNHYKDRQQQAAMSLC